MRFYTKQRRYYCGVDLHASTMYLCVLNAAGEKVLHRNMRNEGSYFLKLVGPYREGLVVCCETTFNWYWLADVCAAEGIEFALGHALYMRAIHGGKTKNDRIDSEKIARLLRGGAVPLAYVYPARMRATRDLMRRRTFFVRTRAGLQGHVKLVGLQYNLDAISEDLRSPGSHAGILERFDFAEDVEASVAADLELVLGYSRVIRRLERKILESAQGHCREDLELLLSIEGIGPVVALTILYEVEDIGRFERVQDFVSYARLVKCSRESGGRAHGFGGVKMGNPYLKWVFSEAVIHLARHHPRIATRLERLEKKHGKGKGKILLAHKIGRAVYFMLKRRTAFDEDRFLATA
jgi:transposase